ncbi:hypothetical protein [Nocardioides sp. SYSU DS0651]|uniref:hypothetical protein n=1 Tax=Nocardioides sp. SYSU DS0651 TaxID=3415955 RepID=UPI003F4BAFE8
MSDGAVGFVADLEAEGLEPEVRGDVVVYRIVPAAGAYAGRPVETGVSVQELQGWPAVPPHWIHAPQEVRFAQTNADRQGVLDGWQRHSRDTGPWDMSRRPILNWLAHVRGVLGQAVSDAA